MGQSSGWLMSRNSSVPRRAFSTFSVFVCTIMPSLTGVVQAVWGGLGIFSISTKHMRHAPSGGILG